MIESLHFHRGYSLRLRKSKPLISYGIIRCPFFERLLEVRCNASGPETFSEKSLADSLLYPTEKNTIYPYSNTCRTCSSITKVSGGRKTSLPFVACARKAALL